MLTIRSAEDNEIIYIENGNGLRATRLILRQGQTVDITFVADKTVGAPQPGDTITITEPSSATSVGFTVLNGDFDAARKQEGRRTIRAVYDTMIEGAGTPLAG